MENTKKTGSKMRKSQEIRHETETLERRNFDFSIFWIFLKDFGIFFFQFSIKNELICGENSDIFAFYSP